MREARTLSCMYVRLLKDCGKRKALSEGRQLHDRIREDGLESNKFVASSLVSMYANCGSLGHARKVFDGVVDFRNVVAWNAMIGGYVKHGSPLQALLLFQRMQAKGISPSQVTFVCILNACARLETLQEGKMVHDEIIRCGYEGNIYIGNALIDMYAKCGSLVHARKVFDEMPSRNVVSWTSIIAGYTKCQMGEEALELSSRMRFQGLKPDGMTFVSILNACSSIAALEYGRRVHADIIEAGLESDMFVRNSLIDMYAKSGDLMQARQIFDCMPKRDAISWTSMIASYVKHGDELEAVVLFQQMKCEGLKPDKVTFVCALNACAGIAALEQGKQVHAEIVKAGIDDDIYVGNALIGMYSKCGDLLNARQVFDTMHERNVVSWSAMLQGYFIHGEGGEAFKLFWQMQQEGNVKPNKITFVSILSVCSHLGLVSEGRDLFYSMSQDYGLEPTLEHYGCMVDLLGRAGCLTEAVALVQTMPMQPDANMWRSLLGACRLHGNLSLAEWVGQQIVNLEPQESAAYVSLMNIYAAGGSCCGKTRLQELMKERKIK